MPPSSSPAKETPVFRSSRNMMVSRILAGPPESAVIHELRQSLTMPKAHTRVDNVFDDDASYNSGSGPGRIGSSVSGSGATRNTGAEARTGNGSVGGASLVRTGTITSQNTAANKSTRYQYKKVAAPTGNRTPTRPHNLTNSSGSGSTSVSGSSPISAVMSGGMGMGMGMGGAGIIGPPMPKKPPPPRRAPSKTMSSESSVVSMQSTKSTKSVRTVRSIFRRKKSDVDEDDDNTVTTTKSTKSKGWWNRSKETSTIPNIPEEEPPPEKTKKHIISFRFKKKSAKRSGRSVTNDQLVADFFDVQSLASEPDYVGNNRLKKASLNGESRSHHMLETQSVSSCRSQRPSFFAALFLRNRAINDEVAGIVDDSPDLVGAGIKYGGEYVDDDEDLTLGSAFENISLMDSLADDESTVDGRDTESFSKSTPVEHDETLFLHRILQRRSQKKEDTNLHKVVGGALPTHTDAAAAAAAANNGNLDASESEVALDDDFKKSPSRSKALIQGNMMHSSTKSLGAMPASSSLDIRTGLIEDSEERPRGPPGGGLCRWDSDRSLGSQTPMAPKRPSRRSNDDCMVSPQPTKSTAPLPKSLKQQPLSSQSMRNLKSPIGESRSRSFSDEDDDDSVLSLLSGLLASWSDERDGINMGTNMSRTTPHGNSGGNGVSSAWSPKSILKTSRHSYGEHKEETREQYSVVFHKIEIREYERVVGDNPSCSRGPPISIGWAYMLAMQYHFDEYERSIRKPKRSKKEFHLGADKRTHLLINEWECCEEDIRKARREATYIQYCRAKTSFSGSRAAAKEAAFLRKANDRTRQKLTNKKLTGMAPMAIVPPESSNSGRSQGRQQQQQFVNSDSASSCRSSLSGSEQLGSSPKPVPRRVSYLEVPQPPPHGSSSRPVIDASLTSDGSQSRHRSLVPA